jgi:hypothetical protein
MVILVEGEPPHSMSVQVAPLSMLFLGKPKMPLAYTVEGAIGSMAIDLTTD